MTTGGKREGAGRKPSKNPRTVVFKARLTPEEHKEVMTLGGAKWVQRLAQMSLENKAKV